MASPRRCAFDGCGLLPTEHPLPAAGRVGQLHSFVEPPATEPQPGPVVTEADVQLVSDAIKRGWNEAQMVAAGRARGIEEERRRCDGLIGMAMVPLAKHGKREAMEVLAQLADAIAKETPDGK